MTPALRNTLIEKPRVLKAPIKAPPKPSRPSGAARTPALKHPGEGYDLPKMHTSKLR